MLSKSGVTESLARQIVATQWDEVPSQVRHQAKRSLVNFFAVTLAGCRSAPIEIVRRSLAEFSGGKQVALIGHATRIDALSAAFLNAAGANVDDFCDTHTATVIHPTAPVAGALFSYAGLRRSAAAISCWLWCSAMRCKPASGSRSRRATITGAGTSPRPAGYSVPPRRSASFCNLMSGRWYGRSALPPRNRPACANAWARRPRA